MRTFRVALLALAVVGLAATVASAISQRSRSPVETKGSVGGVLSVSTVPQSQGEAGTTPDHSACEALTGTENAACRVRANFEAHPNRGLANAIERLEANATSQSAVRPRLALEARGLEVAAAHGAPIAGR